MMTVADGAMESESISNAVIINKDGYSPVPERTDSTIGKSSYLSHATGIYLRDECIMDGEYLCGRVLVPAELPLGIQFRVSSLILFRSAINAHTDAFFDADTNTAIGKCSNHKSFDRLIHALGLLTLSQSNLLLQETYYPIL